MSGVMMVVSSGTAGFELKWVVCEEMMELDG